MPNIFAVIATVAAGIVGGLHLFLHYTRDEREPRTISPYFPFIGPMIELARKKTKYYVELR